MPYDTFHPIYVSYICPAWICCPCCKKPMNGTASEVEHHKILLECKTATCEKYEKKFSYRMELVHINEEE